MYKSEKRTIFYVLSLYLSSTLLLIITLFTSYYFYKQEQLIHTEKEILKTFALEIEDKLASIHGTNNEKYKYPRSDIFNSAIYDIDKNLIFSTLNEKINTLDEEFFFKDSYSYYVSSLKPYYLGAAYTVIQKKTNSMNIISDLISIAVLVIIITIITSFFLVKLVLRPIRDNLHMLDNFIKDTTHELNTPITTILANIETLGSSSCDEKSMKKLQRIKTASKSISNLYEDLVYLLLNHKTSSQNEDLDISKILEQRVNYFTQMAEAKKLSLHVEINKEIYFKADKRKFERLIDNIISNAIKYSNRGTNIIIKLEKSTLSIYDEGKGMSKDEVQTIFDRYRRFDKTQGGFGIGYSIIKSIVDEYNIDININSKVNEGTEVILSW